MFFFSSLSFSRMKKEPKRIENVWKRRWWRNNKYPEKTICGIEWSISCITIHYGMIRHWYGVCLQLPYLLPKSHVAIDWVCWTSFTKNMFTSFSYDSPFSSHHLVLNWILHARYGHSYWMLKEKSDHLVSLYDVAPLSACLKVISGIWSDLLLNRQTTKRK